MKPAKCASKFGSSDWTSLIFSLIFCSLNRFTPVIGEKEFECTSSCANTRDIKIVFIVWNILGQKRLTVRIRGWRRISPQKQRRRLEEWIGWGDRDYCILLQDVVTDLIPLHDPSDCQQKIPSWDPNQGGIKGEGAVPTLNPTQAFLTKLSLNFQNSELPAVILYNAKYSTV